MKWAIYNVTKFTPTTNLLQCLSYHCLSDLSDTFVEATLHTKRLEHMLKNMVICV